MASHRSSCASFAAKIACLVFAASCALGKTPTQEGIVYGEAGGEKLTMDYYAPTGPGPHPVAIIIHGGGFVRGTSKNSNEAYCADFLAPAGYAVFSINYRLARKYPYPAMIQDTQRSIRFIRHYAKRWDANPGSIALVGGSAGGYLSNMAGLLNTPGNASATDPVDRVSARVQAVVTLYGVSDLRGKALDEGMHALMDQQIQEKGEAAALTEGSPLPHVNRDAPPFLFIHGDKDPSVPFSESVNLQMALRRDGVRADLITIPNGAHGTNGWEKVPGVPDWERQMTEWLNGVLKHCGTLGEGIRTRTKS